MSKSIEALEGIGPAKGAKLRKAGCGSAASLLRDGATPAGRKAIARSTGISDSVILRCVNMADLFRIKGVASQYAELLEASGVDTVKELRNRRADNLTEKMEEVNSVKRLCRQTPGLTRVKDWIAQAKKLKPMVKY